MTIEFVNTICLGIIVLGLIALLIIGIMQYRLYHPKMSDEEISARQMDLISPELREKLEEHDKLYPEDAELMVRPETKKMYKDAKDREKLKAKNRIRHNNSVPLFCSPEYGAEE